MVGRRRDSDKGDVTACAYFSMMIVVDAPLKGRTCMLVWCIAFTLDYVIKLPLGKC